MPDVRPSPKHVRMKLANRALTRGGREVLLLGLHRLRDAISSDDTLVFMTRAAGLLELPAGDLEFRQAYPADARDYALAIGTDSPATFVARLTESTRCFVVEHENVLVHASWVTTTAAWTRELNRYVVAPDGGAYVYESFTRPEARGLGVYPFALLGITDRIASERLDTVWVAAEEDNPASLKAISKAGFTEAFRVSYRRRFGRLEIDEPTGPKAAIAAALLSDPSGLPGFGG